MTTAETINIGEKTYSLLFPDLVRPLTNREYQDLKDSIAKHHIRNPVLIDEDNGIIDGANRTRIAAELGLPVIPTRIAECANEEEKRELALSLNLDRRHLSPEERAKLVGERRQRVKKARLAGKSLRAIAGEEGISHVQVKKDLESDAGVNQLTLAQNGSKPSVVDTSESIAPAPVTVKGRDGRRYSSRGRGRKAAQNPKKCRIKGLVKSVKELVEQGKVNAYLAEKFAAQFDRDRQQQFIAEKDGDGICTAINAWEVERKWIEGAEQVLSSWHIDKFAAWDTAKVSSECRQQVLARLRHARDTLNDVLAHVESAAPGQEQRPEEGCDDE
jgi:ParB-like chromosome segregation protein Spo0J